MEPYTSSSFAFSFRNRLLMSSPVMLFVCYNRLRLETLMRFDLYTKTILTLIALLLAAIAFKPIVQPQPVAAQGAFTGAQFSASATNLWAVDTKTGDVWVYDIQSKEVQIH